MNRLKYFLATLLVVYTAGTNAASISFVGDPSCCAGFQVQTVSSTGNGGVGFALEYKDDDYITHGYRFTKEGKLQELLPPKEFKDINPQGLSTDGKVVVGILGNDRVGREEAFIWMPGSEPLSLMKGVESHAYAVSADGKVVVGTAGNPGQAVIWTARQGAKYLNAGQDVPYSSASLVNVDGTVIAGSTQGPDSYTTGFRWTKEQGMVLLGQFPGGKMLRISALSDNGHVIIGKGSQGSEDHPFKWTEATGLSILQSPEGYKSSYPRALTRNGDFIVGVAQTDLIREAVLWDQGGNPQKLGFLHQNAETEAFAVSDDGMIVVGDSTPVCEHDVPPCHQGSEAFIWTKTKGLQSLEDLLISQGTALEGWKLRNAHYLSRDGKTITGYATKGDAQGSFFIAKIGL